MTRTNVRNVILGLALTGALAIGTAWAQPNVQIGALTMGSGTVSSYILDRSVGGTTGLCYQNSVPAGENGYACFEQAVRVSGLGNLLDSSTPFTLLAPTDVAFAHLEGTVGMGAFRSFMSNPAAMAKLVRSSIVQGAYTLSDLAYQAPVATASTSVTTLSGDSLSVAFGAVGYATTSTYVEVGSSAAVDGQSYVSGTPVMIGRNILIPLGRVTLMSLGA